ncbi:DUF31 family protein [Ureaplasma miroungigenitalium]|uniref:DUF31 family protein n=1 Tax=Ureaplasma miroungigenitalium TaxID=1042321 RepID=A0ABT3BMB3_9BACT|nr:DUF31 family protein [Ureaplasma miroungigenitalium]MCV3728385.1 DUF31 family protein [Ureaplasma miroungigenitalium]MCV3734172.1 DUF31 family protein [Ureaplasma miroungigenitalium]
MNWKKHKRVFFPLLASIGLIGLTSVSMVGCFFEKKYERTNKVITQSVVKQNHGFKNGYNHTLSLHFFKKNELQQTIDHTYGTGFILDFEEYNETSKLRTFYIATNIHVIAQVSQDVVNWKLSLGETDLDPSDLHNTQAQYVQNPSSILHGIRTGSWINKNSNQYELFVIGDKSAPIYDNKASDIAILRMQVDKNIFQKLRVFKNFDPSVGISFAHLQKNKNVVGIGYPRLSQFTDLSFNEHYMSDFTNQILNANEQNYRADNPVQYYRNQHLIEQVYSSYDVGLRNFNLGAGASGSLISDEDGNHLGIYWGGLEIKEQGQKQFYGNFTPFFYEDKQNLLDNYFRYLDVYQKTKRIYLPTYLQTHRQTTLTISSEAFGNLKNNYQNMASAEILNFISPGLITGFNDFQVNTIKEIKLVDTPQVKALVFTDEDQHQFIFRFNIK